MNTAYCLFSFDGDQACLEQAVRSIRAFDVTGRIAVFDDGYAPMKRPPMVDFYERSFFNRGGNLNGRECIQAELLCFAKAARLFGARWVVKMDCDTILLDPDKAVRIMEEGRLDMCGSSWEGSETAWGPFYMLRASILPRMSAAVCGIHDLSDEEDKGMTAVCYAAGGNVRLIDFADESERWLNGFDYRVEADVLRFLPAHDQSQRRVALTCGNRACVAKDALGIDRSRELCARAQREILDVFTGQSEAFDFKALMAGYELTATLPEVPACMGETSEFDETWGQRHQRGVVLLAEQPPKFLVTLNLFRDVIHPQSRVSFKAAAKRWGAMYLEITRPLATFHGYTDMEDYRGAWAEKLFLDEHLEDGRYCYVDGDTLINAHAPSPFEIVPPGTWAWTRNNIPPHADTVDHVNEVLPAWLDAISFHGFDCTKLDIAGEYCNTGVIVFDLPAHRAVWEKAREIIRATPHREQIEEWVISDQAPLCAARHLTGVPVQYLPETFHMFWGHQIVHWKPMMHAAIYHFCGDDNRAERIARTKWREPVVGVPKSMSRRLIVSASSPDGPGTHLRKMLASIGIQPKGRDCKCNEHAKEMDARGPAWCEANIATIIEWLAAEALTRPIVGKLFTRTAARGLVLLAIRRSRAVRRGKAGENSVGDVLEA